MYAIDEVTADAGAFRQAVMAPTAYRPLYVKIKLMFGCNLKCVMCNHWRMTREPPLAMDRFFTVLNELAELGCRKIHLSGGEPLLRPQIPELIAHATTLGLRVTMTTNGTLIDKTLARRLVEAGLRGVNVSLDSPDRRVHDRIRGQQPDEVTNWQRISAQTHCRTLRLHRARRGHALQRAALATRRRGQHRHHAHVRAAAPSHGFQP